MVISYFRMSWTDILYPGNRERRNAVVRYVQRLYGYLDRSFDATNELISILNKYVMKEKIQQIVLKESETIKYNADVLVKKLEEAQRVVENYDSILAKQMEPDLYRELKVADLSFTESVRTAEKVSSTVIAICGGVAGFLVLKWLSGTKYITQAASSMRAIGLLAVASLTVSILTLAVDLIVSAIIGAVERSKLEAAIKGLEMTVEEFEPACKEFCQSIYTVSAKLELQF